MTELIRLPAFRVMRSGSQKLLVAMALAVAMAGFTATGAYAGTDTWCSGCTVNPGDGKKSVYDHHFTLVYSHDVDPFHPDLYVGAGVLGCYSIAHGYGEAAHTYSTPCLAYGWGENTVANGWQIKMNIHGNY